MNLLFCVYFYSYNENCFIFLLNFLSISENLSLEVKEPTEESQCPRKKSEMVFCYQNCSDLLWEKIVLVIKILKF